MNDIMLMAFVGGFVGAMLAYVVHRWIRSLVEFDMEDEE